VADSCGESTRGTDPRTSDSPILFLATISRDIAELTSKRHSDVLRDARVMLAQLELDERNFASVYFGGNGEERPQLALTKDLTITLVAGYSAVLRHRIVSRWLELEAEASRPALPDFGDPAAAARAWADQFEQRQRLAAQVEQQQAGLTVAARASQVRADVVGVLLGGG
jgi:phage regulator Rha-like protein